ncbi:MAG: glycosyltransferase family 2 protein [Ferruginibacter sp.]
MAPIENIRLTIAIPTYNRNELLKKNISYLLAQLTDEVSLIVYDNHSDVPVAETLKQDLENYPQLKITRNKVNIGACGNIIKCIELCETQWVWLLSDDDEPHKSAVETILKYIAVYPELHYVNFKSNYTLQREQNIHITGENEFIEKIDNIHNLFLISCGLYNVEAVRPFIKFAYLFSYSLVPHFVMVIMSLKNTGKVIFSKDLLINSQGIHKDPNQAWSYLPLSLGLPTLVELPLNLTKENHSKISGFIKNQVITRPVTSLERVLNSYKKEDINVLKYNFSQPYLRLSPGMSFFWKLEYLICIVVLKFPLLITIFLFTLTRLRNLFKKPVTTFASDRFNRL